MINDIRFYIAPILLLIFYSCQLPPGNIHKDPKFSFDFEGEERTYFVHAPNSIKGKSKVPLVFVLHGGGGLAEKMNNFLNGEFNKLADENDFIVVYPQGLQKSWNDGRESDRIWAQGNNINDLGFFNALLDTMENRYSIDPDRVFATGISNGGFMSIRLACEMSDRIRAVAPVTAQLSEPMRNSCTNTNVSPIFLLNGTKDPLVPYDGGSVRVLGGPERGRILSTEETIEIWKKNLNCSDQAIEYIFPDKDSTDGAKAVKYTYNDCEDNNIVSLIRIDGGGHTWPGAKQYLSKGLIGTVCNDFSGCEEIWNYFKQF